MTTVAGIHQGLDTHANRPVATAVTAGTLYSCSDHSLIYISDGSAWSTYATLGGGSGVTVVSAIGDKSANRTTTSTSFVDLTDMSVAIPAVAGDKLEISYNCTCLQTTNNAYIRFVSNISGTGVIDPASMPGFVTAIANVAHVVSHLAYHVVQAGDISGGNVTVKMQWLVNTGTGTVLNESSFNRAPIMVVKNFGQ